MSELIQIWDGAQLAAAGTLPPFPIPNNPNARGIKINNQSRFWLFLTKTQTGTKVDRIEPFSYINIPYEPDLSLVVDTTDQTENSSLQPDRQFVDYTTTAAFLGLAKGSTQFSGAASVSIAGNVNIGNSQLAVDIQGTPTVNLGAGNTISISGTPTFNVGTMPAVTFAAGSSVQITGTPTMNIGQMPAVTFAAGSQVEITGTPTMNIGTMPSVNIANATLKVAIDTTTGNNEVVISGTPNVSISGTPTMNIGTMPNVTFAAGSSVAITGTPTMNIGTMPSVTFAAGSSVAISGTPTMNIGTMPNVTIANATLKVAIDTTTGNNEVVISGTPNVSISGTPTMNIGTMPNVTFAAGSTVSISGTPTMNIGSMPAVTFAAGSTVSISGTPTMNIGTMPNVTIANATLKVAIDTTTGNNEVVISGTPSVSISGTPTMNIGTMPNVTIANATLKVAIDTTTGNNEVVISGTPNVSISGTPTMNIGTMPSVTFAAGSSVAITGTPTMNIGTMPNVTIANATLKVAIDTTSGNNSVVISGTPSVSISGTPTMNIGTMPNVTFAAGSTVSISGTPTMNINSMPAVTFAAGSTVAISGTPTMNINSMPNVTIASGTVNVSSATISNNQLPVTMLYNGYKSFTFPAGSSGQTFVFQFLPNGDMIEFHRILIYVKSANGYSYTVSSINQKTVFGDGFAVQSASNGGNTSLVVNQDPNNANWWIADTAFPQTANQFSVLLSTSNGGNTAAADTVTLYYCIDGNDTAIEVPQNDGVAVKPSMGTLQDGSGTIPTANTSSSLMPAGMQVMRYFLFQNLSGSDMYLNLTGGTAGTGPGNILIPAGGGDLCFENGFIPMNGINIYCSTAGAAYTLVYA